jgi:hypothetical protein
MLLGVMLLYVGAVLCVNGIWLVGQARAAALARAAPSAGATQSGAASTAVEAHPTFLEGREVTIINIFTGFVGLVTAVTLLVQGNSKGELGDVAGGGFILLFAFTYLWVAANQFLNVKGHAFGWYCLFVALTAVPAGIYVLRDAGSNTGSIWLGLNWFAWAVLWFLFWVLLTLERPIARVTGYLAILVGIATSWVLGFLILEGVVHL